MNHTSSEPRSTLPEDRAVRARRFPLLRGTTTSGSSVPMPRLSMPPPGTAAGIEADELSSRTSGPEPVYISVVSNRTNETVKVLTIIGTIFIPLTFLAGVYGMNMPIPENAWWFSYPLFWLACLAVSGGMLLWFRRRGWL